LRTAGLCGTPARLSPQPTTTNDSTCTWHMFASQVSCSTQKHCLDKAQIAASSDRDVAARG
jgi:hypothetical protein